MLEPNLLEELFFYYCCTIGIIGNTLTCLLLKRRINRFKSYLASKRDFLNKSTSLRASTYSSTTNGTSNACTSGGGGGNASGENGTTSNTNNKQRIAQMHVNKCILFDYRHNWNLYLYFIGLNIFDTAVLINWIVSRLSVKLGGYSSRFLYMVDSEYDWEDAAVNSSRLDEQDYERLRRSMKFSNKQNESEFDFSLPFSSLIRELNRQSRYMEIKFIHLQGVCQVYYYFTIVGLQASLAYTLACLFDRMFKLKCINRDIIESLKKGKWATINTTPPSNEFAATTTITTNNEVQIHPPQPVRVHQRLASFKMSTKRIPKGLNTMFNPKNQQLRALTKSGHSEMVKQFFGRTSAYFIGLIIIYFYFHLMSLYGATDNELLERFNSIPYRFWPTGNFSFSNDSHSFYSSPFENNSNYYSYVSVVKNKTNLSSTSSSTSFGPKPYLDVYFMTQTNVSQCQLYNLNTRLPFFIMAFDLLILLFCEAAKFGCILILINFYVKRVRAQMTADAQRLQNRYLLIRCVLIFSILGLILEMPSLIMRNLQIILITLISIYNTNNKSQSSSTSSGGGGESLFSSLSNSSLSNSSSNLLNSTVFSTPSSTVLTSTISSMSTLLSTTPSGGGDFITTTPLSNATRINQLKLIYDYLSNYTDLFDKLLFISSSHKFIVFLVFAHLVRLPRCWNWRCFWGWFTRSRSGANRHHHHHHNHNHRHRHRHRHDSRDDDDIFYVDETPTNTTMNNNNNNNNHQTNQNNQNSNPSTINSIDPNPNPNPNPNSHEKFANEGEENKENSNLIVRVVI